MIRPALCAVVCAIACGAPTQSPPTLAPRPVNTPDTPDVADELTPTLAAVAWLRGDWHVGGGAAGAGGTEHWVAAGGALYGVGLLPGGDFEVMIIDDAAGPGPADGALRFYAMPGGRPAIEFAEQARQRRGVVFANPAHDHPKTVGYFVDADGFLHAEVTGDEPTAKFTYTAGAAARAPEIEAADRAFAADTSKRGIDGWMAAFEPTGWILAATGKVEGAAIAELVAPVLQGGTASWAPLASGVAGDLGFTVGTAAFTSTQPGATWRSSYVAIWARQADRTWKVRFATGRRVNEP